MLMLLVGLIVGVLLAVVLPEAWGGLREAVSDATREVLLEPAMILIAIAIALVVIAVLASDTAKTAIAVGVIALSALWLVDRVTLQAEADEEPNLELIDLDHAGPVEMAQTTLENATAIFGRPDANKIVRRGSIQVRRARWGKELTIYFGKGPDGVALEVHVRRKEITTKTEGDMRIQTNEGLQVGNPTSRVKELYPGAQRHQLEGRTIWELEKSPQRGRLRAITDNGKVDTLANAPYDYS
jgi:hypothetical protein